MKVIFIPFNKKNLVYLALSIVVIVIIALIFSNANSQGVFNINSAPQPIYKGDESITKVSFACNVVWGTE